MLLNQITTNISLYVSHFLFEILDEYTISVIEKGIKNYLIELKIIDYKLKTTILDKTDVKINLQYDDKNIDFMITR